jgi:alkylation response protein AidB-like acyl-CoA dehydrogenase
MSSLDVGRISLSASSLGTSERAIELALEHSRKRVQFGRPIAEQQAIQFKLADMGMRTLSLRYLVYLVASMAENLGIDSRKWMKSERQLLKRNAAIAKVAGSETASFCVDESLQIHGGSGFVKSSEIERMYRDARISEIYEGTSEIQRMIIGRDMVQRGW